MAIGSIQTAGNGFTGGTAGQAELSEETFLRLLSAQLQNQDPLEPASDVEFIQQMATFASLEQQRITNSNLNVMQLYEASINNSNALGIVGKEVKLQNNEINHEVGESHLLYYDSDSMAARVKITVTDSSGKEVFSTTQVGAEDGEQEFIWHGVDNDGNPVDEGDYEVNISLDDGDGNTFASPVYQRQRVTGLSYENGTIMVMMGDQKLPIENIVEVFEASPERAPVGFNKSPKFGVLPGFGQALHSALQPPQQQPIRPFRVIPGGR